MKAIKEAGVVSPELKQEIMNYLTGLYKAGYGYDKRVKSLIDDFDLDEETADGLVSDWIKPDVDAAVEDLFDMYSACKAEPKVCNAIKADGEKTSIFLGSGNSVGGIARALRDGRLLKVVGFN